MSGSSRKDFISITLVAHYDITRRVLGINEYPFLQTNHSGHDTRILKKIGVSHRNRLIDTTPLAFCVAV